MENMKYKSLSPFIFIPLAFIVFIRPFVSGLAYPSFEFYYENVVILLAILLIIFKLNNNRVQIEACKYPLLLLISAYISSNIFSVNIQNSLKETVKFISYASLFFLVLQADFKQKNIIIKSIVIAASIISIYSIYQYFFGYSHTLEYLKKFDNNFLSTSSYARDILLAKRAIGTFPSPNILGSYLAMCFFLVLYLISNDRLNIIWYLSLSIITISLVLTKSMGAWLSLSGTICLAFIIFSKTTKKKTILVTAAPVLFVLIFITINRWERFIDLQNPQNSITQRLNYWQTAINMIKAHPIFGVGPANFQELFLKYKAGLSTDTRYAHNILLNMWAETGILGIAGMSLLIINLLRKLFTKQGEGFLLLGGLVFLLHNLIDNSYFIPETGFLWWVLLGIAFIR